MSYHILGISKEEYKNRITRKTAACAGILLAAAVISTALCIFRTDALHLAFLIINIVLDSIALSAVFFCVSTQIRPMRKLYALALREKSARELRGIITEMSEETQIVYGLECQEITVEEENIRKVFVVKEAEVPFELHGEAVLYIVDNIVVRAEVQ